MKKLFVGILILFGIFGLFWVSVFTGRPGECGLGKIQISGEEARLLLNKLNLLMEGELEEVIISDRVLTQLVQDRLDPSVENFQICFFEDKAGVSGSVENNMGWRMPFLVYGNLVFLDKHPVVKSLDVSIGRLGEVGFAKNLLSKKVERKINASFRGVYAGSVYQVKFYPGKMVVSRRNE